MYNLSKERSSNVIYFNYLSDDTVRAGLGAGRLFKGVFRANPDNIWEGRVNLRVAPQRGFQHRSARKNPEC